MASGLKNRVLVVECNEVGHLSEPLLEADTGKELPSRLAVHPSGKELICGLECAPSTHTRVRVRVQYDDSETD